MSDLRTTNKNTPPDTATLPLLPTSEYPSDSAISQRVVALREAYPTIPLPVALAMVERASLDRMGVILGRLEDTLGELDQLDGFEKLSGSQLRVLDVILGQVVARISRVRAALQLGSEDR